MSRSRLRELPLSSSLCLGLQAALVISRVAKHMPGGATTSVMQAAKITHCQDTLWLHAGKLTKGSSSEHKFSCNIPKD